LFLLLLAVALAACGGDDEGTTTAAPPPPTAGPIVTLTQPENTAQPEPRPTGRPTFTVAVSAENTTPVAGRPWRYTVTARARGGAPAGGTAKMRVFVEGELVDTLGFIAFSGRLSRTHVWPAILKGKEDVVLQAEVEGEGGTQRANLPVTVR
jgi:hypothetical protein